ncbi:FliM/FliN family flagellar motor switch protein [Isoptericola sp. NEAU-Y5]|uniref:FliM/FliN family flagellar motor switch protein n=1 Tax=Isoptericola luteus TaxID=2879484 RepID=A0ABS7ZKV1_9MICO|nr:FliM/FliN family flagellar motor switch protein [Isoptericola sp. NEAU-Y5]MCA5895122.1 FliM/FliN family flagellar motor switch protein [Isoptericola sp. NEAU-Y5]
MSTATSPDRSAVDAATQAAAALVALIPTPAPLRAVRREQAPVVPAGAATVLASYVGGAGTDLALVLVDQASLADASEAGPVEVTDVLRPALEAAGAATGTGVLTEVRPGDASELLADGGSVVFELTGGDEPAGWFAVRTRRTTSAPRDTVVSDNRLARISNVQMRVEVVVGRTRMAVRDVLGLEPGAVVELDRSAGAPADVQLNGRTIAKGEVVVVDGGDYGVRITTLLDADD